MKENIVKANAVLIENRIFNIRNKQVMIDRDLAELYGVETKALNQAVKRNIERFPKSFRFQLADFEFVELVTVCDRFGNLKHSASLPYAFTEQGVAMLSAVLRSETAIQVSVQIMEAFVEMREIISGNALVFSRLDRLERSQLQNDQKFEQLFKALEAGNIPSNKGIFFEGQIFDAYVFIANLVRKAEKSIILIDNYIDESVLTLFAKKNPNVSLQIFTKQISKQLKLDVDRFVAQYGEVKLTEFGLSHDRFLIIDEKELYHIGASLKDLGKKWFAFSELDAEVVSLLSKLELG